LSAQRPQNGARVGDRIRRFVPIRAATWLPKSKTICCQRFSNASRLHGGSNEVRRLCNDDQLRLAVTRAQRVPRPVAILVIGAVTVLLIRAAAALGL
jgi:hypothetical protein